MAPLVLLLVEPTSWVSDAESLPVIGQVRRMTGLVGAGLVVIDHDLNFITDICDRIICLDRGKLIASGTPTEIQTHSAAQASCLGTSAVD